MNKRKCEDALVVKGKDEPCHIVLLPAELLVIVLCFCEEYAFVSQFVCKRWKNAWTAHVPPRDMEINPKDTRVSLSFVQWGVSLGKPLTTVTMERAARYGDMEILEWGIENGCKWCGRRCSEATAGGYIEILVWARENGCPWNEVACFTAAGGGQLEALRWARENGCPWDRERCKYIATKNNRAQVAEWIDSQTSS